MNLIEALQELKKGRKVKRKVWKNEYIHYNENGSIVREDGSSYPLVIHDINQFNNDTWELYEPILDGVEKQYLSNIITPFRDKIESIVKKRYMHNYEGIVIKYNDELGEDGLCFPLFKEGNMYKRMEIGREYTLVELGL